jgi:hypothetical protein
MLVFLIVWAMCAGFYGFASQNEWGDGHWIKVFGYSFLFTCVCWTATTL